MNWTYVYAGWGTEIDFVSNFPPVLLPLLPTTKFLLSDVSKLLVMYKSDGGASKFLLICLLEGRRTNAGGILLILDASFEASRCGLPLLLKSKFHSSKESDADDERMRDFIKNSSLICYNEFFKTNL